MERKKETFVYKGLGFPVKLIDAPMKKMLGEWVIDINMNVLQLTVFKRLIHKSLPLTGKELRFMRQYLELSTSDLGEKLGVSHAAIIKWEKEQAKISPIQEIYIRMFFCEFLKDLELFNLFKEIRPNMLAQAKHEKSVPLSIHPKQLQEAC